MQEEIQQKAADQTLRLTLGGYGDLAGVYDLIRKQFPREETYQLREFMQMVNKDKYKILLYQRESDQQRIGYATTYSIPSCKTVWLDLFAVLPEFQGKGYGQRLFEAVYQKYCGAYDGLLLCAEKVDGSDPAKAEVQRRRLAFYHKVGAAVLHTEFLLPVESGGFPMYLLYKPRHGVKRLPKESQMEIIQSMFEYCYGHIRHRQQLFQQFKHTMIDENFESMR